MPPSHCLSPLDAVLPAARRQGEHSLAIQDQSALWSNSKASLEGEMSSLWHRKISRWSKEPAKLARATLLPQQGQGRKPKWPSHRRWSIPEALGTRLLPGICQLTQHQAWAASPRDLNLPKINTLSSNMHLSASLHLSKAVNES